ncbi:hypothetical protein HQ447_20640 [bacterium]|nr:hypothetical protein [bacterium]
MAGVDPLPAAGQPWPAIGGVLVPLDGSVPILDASANLALLAISAFFNILRRNDSVRASILTFISHNSCRVGGRGFSKLGGGGGSSIGKFVAGPRQMESWIANREDEP